MRSKLASSTPAPISNIKANATWLVTSTRRISSRAAALRAAAAFFANHLRHVGAPHRDHGNHADADADHDDQQRR